MTRIYTFQLYGDSLIVVKQERGDCARTVGVEYSGNYYNSNYIKETGVSEEETLLSLRIFDTQQQDSIFRQLTQNDYDLFLNSTQLTNPDDSDVDNLRAKVQSSGVRGLFTIMENIIMIDSSKRIWAAVIDDNKVFYYTNVKNYRAKLPKTIELWRSRFKEYPVIYKSK